MPTAVSMKKIRKAQGAAVGCRSNKVAAPQQSSHPASNINSFARVSKSIGNNDLKKASSATPISQKNVLSEAITSTPDSRKRKAVAPIEDSDSSADDEATPTKPTLSRNAWKATATPSPVKRGRGRPAKKTRSTPASAPALAPITKPVLAPASAPAPALRKKRARSPSPSISAISDSEKSTVDAGALFKRLRIESSPSRCSSPATADTSIAGSDDDDETDYNNNNNNTATKRNLPLPDDLLALIDLHSAFLKTLTLHYAHNGTNVPADLRVVLPNVARAWGKKMVTEADVRVCLGVLNLNNNNSNTTTSSSTSAVGNNLFSLSNYGRGKICIEIDPSHGSGPLDEKKLNGLFRANLTSLWIQRRAANTKGGRRGGAAAAAALPSDNTTTAATAFMQTLPKAPITICESVAKASPVLAKGQRRLEELKHGIALKNENQKNRDQSQKTKMNQTTTAASENAPMLNADGTKMSLLDRIRHRALLKSTSSLGGASAANLTPAQLARRAALQRAPAVAAVIGMLARASSNDSGSGFGGRVSFTMAALLEKLKDSMRSGISREEGAACVRRLAGEVAPEWVRVVVMSGREMVVVEVERELSRAEVERRVGVLVMNV